MNIKNKFIIILLLTGCMVGQVSARVFTVNSLSSFNNALSQASSDDTISWRPGTYRDIDITLNKDNIVLMAQRSGQTIFKGKSKLFVTGNQNVVRGFQYVGGRLDVDTDVILVRGDKNRFSDVNIKDYYCRRYVTISHVAQRTAFRYCTFENRTSIIEKNIFQVGANKDQINYTKITHCQFKNFTGPGNGKDFGVEAIRIGIMPQGDYKSRAVVEYCYFTRCDGDAEIISNKSTENMYRYNTFENNPYGWLELRHGRKAIVYGNFFIDGLGGLKIREGNQHSVYNNYFSDLKDAIWIKNDGVDTPKDIYIAHNTMVNTSGLRLGGKGDFPKRNDLSPNKK